MSSEAEKKLDAEIIDCKVLKAKHKSAFTKTKNKILRLLQVEDPCTINRKDIRFLPEQFDALQDNVVEIIERLCILYKEKGDTDNAKKVADEMDLTKQ
jgi:hypothetical protein